MLLRLKTTLISLFYNKQEELTVLKLLMPFLRSIKRITLLFKTT